jgi:hypothetical protein
MRKREAEIEIKWKLKVGNERHWIIVSKNAVMNNSRLQR